jgi:hypothetical protein
MAMQITPAMSCIHGVKVDAEVEVLDVNATSATEEAAPGDDVEWSGWLTEAMFRSPGWKIYVPVFLKQTSLTIRVDCAWYYI